MKQELRTPEEGDQQMVVRKTGWAVFVMVAALSGLTGCGRAVETAQEATPASAVEALLVQESLAPDYRVVSAVLTNRDVGDARARIGGKLRLWPRHGLRGRRQPSRLQLRERHLSLGVFWPQQPRATSDC